MGKRKCKIGNGKWWMKNAEQFYLRSRAWKSKAFSARGIRAWMRPKIGTHSVTSWVQRGVHRADLWRPCKERERRKMMYSTIYNVKESVLIIWLCSWKYKEYFPLPFTKCICCKDLIQKEFENLLSINVERNKREQETKQATHRDREGEKERETDRWQTNQTTNVDCVVCLAKGFNEPQTRSNVRHCEEA